MEFVSTTLLGGLLVTGKISFACKSKRMSWILVQQPWIQVCAFCQGYALSALKSARSERWLQGIAIRWGLNFWWGRGGGAWCHSVTQGECHLAF